jgi:hypothetical protein
MAKEDLEHFELMEKRRKATGLSWSQRFYMNKLPESNATLIDTLFFYLLNRHHPQMFAKREAVSIGLPAVEAVLRARTLGARTIALVLPTYEEARPLYREIRTRNCYVADINVGEVPPIPVCDYGFMFAVETFVHSPKAYATIRHWANFMFIEGGFCGHHALSREETELCLKQNYSFVMRIKESILNTKAAIYDSDESSETSRTLWLARR